MANPRGINQYTGTGKTSKSAAKALNKTRKQSKKYNAAKQTAVIERMRSKKK